MQNKLFNDPSDLPTSSKTQETNFGSALSAFALLLVVGFTLTVGLLPRGSFKENWLQWGGHSLGTEFGHYGLVHGEFPDVSNSLDSHHQLIFDLVIIPRPFTSSDFRILVQLDSIPDTEPFIIGQWENRLIVMQGRDYANKARLPRLEVDIGEFINKELNVLIKLSKGRNELHIDRQLVQHHAPSFYVLGKADARITVGNSPDGKHGWSGGVQKFDVSLLNLNNDQSELLRRYDFRSPVQREILDLSEQASSLKIPKPGNFPEKPKLQRVEIEHLFSKNKLDLIVNILGFLPLGFLVSLVIRQRIPSSRYLRPLCGAIVFGGVVSLGIEISQPWIPGRNSHIHDLVLNVLGAATGGLLCVALGFVYDTLKQTQSEEISTL